MLVVFICLSTSLSMIISVIIIMGSFRACPLLSAPSKLHLRGSMDNLVEYCLFTCDLKVKVCVYVCVFLCVCVLFIQ